MPPGTHLDATRETSCRSGTTVLARGLPLKLYTPVVTAAAVGVLATLLISVVPFVRFAYREPGLHLALDVAAAMIGFLVAFLLVGRFRQRPELSNLVLVFAMLLFAVANLSLSAFPRALSDRLGATTTWSQVLLRTVASVIFASAPLMPRRLMTARPRTWIVVGALLIVTIGSVVLAVSLVETLPPALDPRLSPESSRRPRVVGHPLALNAQLVSMAAFAMGAVGFYQAARERGDEFFAWCAAGAALAALSRFNFFLFPSVYSDWFYTGDLLRFGFYCLLLVGAGREIRSYWVRDERRRIARDLHDGLAQELAFLVSHTRRLRQAGEAEPRSLEMLSAAAQRALDESRRAITLLSTRRDEPLARVLDQTARSIAQRHDVGVQVEVDSLPALDVEVRETLLRILREAMTNVGRHARATTAKVELTTADGAVELRVRDDGIGFETGAVSEPGLAGGFGLISMAERVEAHGGRFMVESAPGRGTEVVVWLPRRARRGR